MAEVIIRSNSASIRSRALALNEEGAVLHLDGNYPELSPGMTMSVLAEQAVYSGKLIFKEEHPQAVRLHVRFLN